MRLRLMWIPFVFTAATAAAACDAPPNVCPEGTSPVKDQGCVPTACEGPGCSALPDGPGAVKACYSGPPGTLGKGICAAGTQTCNEDGSGCGPCAGETLPRPLEDCATLEDDDCDGQATCDGAALWSKRWGGKYTDVGESVATDANDNVYLAGRLGEAWDFGGGISTPPPNPASPDIFLVKYDAAGNHVWDHVFKATSGFSDYGLALSADAAGGLYLTGEFTGSVMFDKGCDLSTSFSRTAFLAKFDASGACVFAKKIGDGTMTNYFSVRVNAAGETLLLGSFLDAITIGSTTLTSQGQLDAFVAKLDATGSPVWAKRFGGPADDYADVAFDSHGGVIVAGGLQGNAMLDGESKASAGSHDFFVGSYAPDGGKRWLKTTRDVANQSPGRILVDPESDDIILIGHTLDSFKFDGDDKPDHVLMGQGDPIQTIFALKMKSDGSWIWGKSFPTGQTQLNNAQLDPLGNLIFIGTSLGGTSFGGAPLPVPNPSAYRAVAVKLDPQGGHVWSHLYGGAGLPIPVSLVIDQHGNAILTGQFQTMIDFGLGELTATPAADPCPDGFLGCDDGFIAKLGP